MLDLDLGQRIGEELRSAVDDLTPSARLDVLVGRRVRRRRRQRRLAVGGGAVVAVALVVGLAAVAGDGSRSPSVVASGEGGEAQPVFLVPGDVPDGMEVVHAAGGDTPGVAGAAEELSVWPWTQRWVQVDATGEIAQLVDVQWAAGGETEDPLGAVSSEPVTVRGRPGAYADGEGLTWEEPDGTRVLIDGDALAGGGRSPVGRATLTAFAESLVADGEGGFDVQEPPEGFQLAGAWPGTGSEGTNPRALVYQDRDGRGFQVHTVDDSDRPPGMNLHHPGARVDTELGAGVLTPILSAPPAVDDPEWSQFVSQAADLHLQWEDDRGLRTTVSGVGLSEEELRTIARGLRPVDADTWFALQGRPEEDAGAVGPSDTTSSSRPPAPDPGRIETTTPPVTEPPAAGPATIRVTGTYEGIERYSPSEEDGCDVASVLDSTLTLADGSTWQHHAEYCGEIEGDLWSSAGGAFIFTLPDGSTLTGTMPAQVVPIDSDGEPYALTITGGTGGYADATGSCRLDNHLADIASGVQSQTGTLVCNIDR